jgi:hypothetical protein
MNMPPWVTGLVHHIQQVVTAIPGALTAVIGDKPYPARSLLITIAAAAVIVWLVVWLVGKKKSGK